MSGKVQNSLRQLANFHHHLQCANKHTRNGYSQAARLISKKRAMTLYTGSDELTLLEGEMKPFRIVGKKKGCLLIDKPHRLLPSKAKIFRFVFPFSSSFH